MQNLRTVLTGRKRAAFIGIGVLFVLLLLGWVSAERAGAHYQSNYDQTVRTMQKLARDANAVKLSDLPTEDDPRVNDKVRADYAARCNHLDNVLQQTRTGEMAGTLRWQPLGFLSVKYRKAHTLSAEFAQAYAAFKTASNTHLQALKQYCVVTQGDLPTKIQEAAAEKEYQKTLFFGSATIHIDLTHYRIYTCHTASGCRPDRAQTKQFAAFAKAYKHRWIDVPKAEFAVNKTYPKRYHYCTQPEAEAICILNYQKAKQVLALHEKYYQALMHGKSDTAIEKIANDIGAFNKQWNKDYYAVLKKTFPHDDTNKQGYIERKGKALLQGHETKLRQAAAALLQQL